MDDKSKKPASFPDVRLTSLHIPEDTALSPLTQQVTSFHFKFRRTNRAFLLLCGALLFLAGCSPRIYEFDVNPLTTGLNDTVNVSWAVKGVPVLLVHDVNYPASGASGLADITLVVVQHGKTLSYTLHAADTLKLQVAARGSLRIAKKQDNITDDRLRYLTLVAKKGKTETDSVKQVAMRPDGASDEIGYRPFARGDSLIAEGVNNPARWGHDFEISTVTDESNRALEIYHATIRTSLKAGDPPDRAFTGTPVQGYWQFRTLMTDDEKHNLKPLPRMIRILITIKRNTNVSAKH